MSRLVSSCFVALALAAVAPRATPAARAAEPVPEGPVRIHPAKVAEPMCFGMLSSSDVVFVTRRKSGCKDGTCEYGSYLARTDRKRAETVGYLAYAKGPTPPDAAAIGKGTAPKSLETANGKLDEADLACATVVVPASGKATFTVGGYPLTVHREGLAIIVTNANGVAATWGSATPDLESVTALHYSPRDPRLVVRVAIANPDGSTDERFAWWAPRHLPAPARTRAPWVAPAPGTLLATDVAHAGCLGAREADDAMFVLLQTADCTSEACTRTAEVVGLGAGAAALGGRPVRVASATGPLAPDDAALVAGVDAAALAKVNAALAGAVLACEETPVSGSHALVIGATKVAMSVAAGGPVLRSELGGEWRGFVPKAGETAVVFGSHPKLRMAYVRSAQAGESRYEDRVSAVPLAKTFFHKNAADVAEEERQRAAAADASARAQSDMAAAIERAKAVAEEEKRQAAERAEREAAARAEREARDAAARTEREARDAAARTEREARAKEAADKAAAERAEREARAKEAADKAAAERARLQAPPPGALEERAKAIKVIDAPLPADWWNVEYRCLGWSTDEPTVYVVRWFSSEHSDEAVLSHITKDGSYKLVTLAKDGDLWKHMWAGADRKVQTSELGCVGGDSGALQGVPFEVKVDGTKLMLTVGAESKLVGRLGGGVEGTNETYVGALWHPTLPYLVLEIVVVGEYSRSTRYIWQDLTKLIAKAAPKPE